MRKERGQKSEYKRKERQPSPYSQIREVCYPQGASVELDVHYQLSPLITTFILITYFIHFTHMHI